MNLEGKVLFEGRMNNRTQRVQKLNTNPIYALCFMGEQRSYLCRQGQLATYNMG
jgi:hypothetical protein